MLQCRSILPLFTLAAALISAPATAEQGEKVHGGVLCKETTQFALCTSAPCTIDPNDPKMAICDCEVASGPNWGKTSCADRLPDGTGLYSNFSPSQMGPPTNYRSLTCENEMPWASCLGAPCRLRTEDPNKATCLCPISNETPWFTYGGDCDAKACEKLWSAAAVQDFTDVYQAFARLGVPGADAPQCAAP